jgi:TPR repeat protein
MVLRETGQLFRQNKKTKRFFLLLFILAAPLLTRAALAEDAPSPPESGDAVIAPPSTDEYNNIPPGMLMSSDDSTAPQETQQSEEEVMTMTDLVAAYNKGQFDLVAKHLLPIADSNYPQAEEMLGIMYHNGTGVPRDPAKALDWLTKAAEAGRPLAQHHLAIINYTGDGVQKDSVTALMWLYIAIAHYQDGGEKTRAMQDRDNVSQQLSRRDKKRALDLAREWMNKRNDAALLEDQDQ